MRAFEQHSYAARVPKADAPTTKKKQGPRSAYREPRAKSILFRLRFLSGCVDADKLAPLGPGLKLDLTLNQGKQGVIFATADIGAGVESCATLTYKNRTGGHLLTTETLDAKTFAAVLPTIPVLPGCFLLSHGLPPKPWLAPP